MEKLARMEEHAIKRMLGHAKVDLAHALSSFPAALKHSVAHDATTARAILTHMVADFFRNYKERDVHEIGARLMRRIIQAGKPQHCFESVGRSQHVMREVACLSPDGKVHACVQETFSHGAIKRGCATPGQSVSWGSSRCKHKHGHELCHCERDLCNTAGSSTRRLLTAAGCSSLAVVVATAMALSWPL